MSSTAHFRENLPRVLERPGAPSTNSREEAEFAGGFERSRRWGARCFRGRRWWGPSMRAEAVDRRWFFILVVYLVQSESHTSKIQWWRWGCRGLRSSPWGDWLKKATVRDGCPCNRAVAFHDWLRHTQALCSCLIIFSSSKQKFGSSRAMMIQAAVCGKREASLGCQMTVQEVQNWTDDTCFVLLLKCIDRVKHHDVC